MLYKSLQIVKEKILAYNSNTMDRDTLSSWAYDALMGMLHNEKTFFIDNLVAYPLLSALSIKSNSPERCSDDEILSFLDIIEGRRTKRFSFFLKILQPTSESHDVSLIKNLVSIYEQERFFSETDLDTIEELALAYENKPIENIDELLIINILQLLSYLPKDLGNIEEQDCGIEADGINVGYGEIKFDFIMEKLLNIIKMLTGEQCLYISVNYENGNVLVALS